MSATSYESQQTVYIVQRLDWVYQDFLYEIEDEQPIRAFADRRDAEKLCRRLDEEERALWPVAKLARRSGDTDAFYEVIVVELA